MPTPRPEADMVHMQHAHVVALLVRQHEAARLKAERDAVAEPRRAAGLGTTAAEPALEPGRDRLAAEVHRPRPA